MDFSEEQARAQLEETEKANRQLRLRLEEVERILEPFIAFAETCQHLADQERIVSRPAQKLSGYQMRNLIALDFKALLDWSREGKGKLAKGYLTAGKTRQRQR